MNGILIGIKENDDKQVKRIVSYKYLENIYKNIMPESLEKHALELLPYIGEYTRYYSSNNHKNYTEKNRKIIEAKVKDFFDNDVTSVPDYVGSDFEFSNNTEENELLESLIQIYSQMRFRAYKEIIRLSFAILDGGKISFGEYKFVLNLLTSFSLEAMYNTIVLYGNIKAAKMNNSLMRLASIYLSSVSLPESELSTLVGFKEWENHKDEITNYLQRQLELQKQEKALRLDEE